MNDENFWSDSKKAQSIIQETNSNKDLISSYNLILKGFKDLDESLEELKTVFDEELMTLVLDEYEGLMKDRKSVV